MLFNYKTKRTVSELFFRLKYPCVNTELLYFYLTSVFLHTVLYFIKKSFVLRILRFPGYFETSLFRTFFHFPWDFEIAGFNCSVIKKLQEIHFGAQIIAVPCREELIHSPLVPTRAKGSVVNGVLSLYYLALLLFFAYFYQRNSGKIQKLLT